MYMISMHVSCAYIPCDDHYVYAYMKMIKRAHKEPCFTRKVLYTYMYSYMFMYVSYLYFLCAYDYVYTCMNMIERAQKALQLATNARSSICRCMHIYIYICIYIYI